LLAYFLVSHDVHPYVNEVEESRFRLLSRPTSRFNDEKHKDVLVETRSIYRDESDESRDALAYGKTIRNSDVDYARARQHFVPRIGNSLRERARRIDGIARVPHAHVFLCACVRACVRAYTEGHKERASKERTCVYACNL